MNFSLHYTTSVNVHVKIYSNYEQHITVGFLIGRETYKGGGEFMISNEALKKVARKRCYYAVEVDN